MSCFFDKKGILSVKFPKSLKKINPKAFRNCVSLEKIEFQNDNFYTVTIGKDILQYAPLFPDKAIRTLVESELIYSVAQ